MKASTLRIACAPGCRPREALSGVDRAFLGGTRCRLLRRPPSASSIAIAKHAATTRCLRTRNTLPRCCRQPSSIRPMVMSTARDPPRRCAADPQLPLSMPHAVSASA
ncbi:hypothetical protein HaLaN_31424 [Haematococcus lacustris]|uniref:Uncharacterized protein n=1 Tax=Haematococcus lacustris TaxID=44745 RepID=A0A6A0AK94_HAELA|nr:hypothetical protein HaLaN_31424 [Haematococcus lacustris]